MRTKILVTLLLGFAVWMNSGIGQDLKGFVKSQTENEAMEYATISLFSLPDSSLVTGSMTDDLGRFEIKVVEKGNYYIIVQFLGYNDYQSERFSTKIPIDLGIIELGANNMALAEIEVTGRSVTSMHKIDKQVFDAQQFQAAKGGTAIDVLKNLPSVGVNAQGGITLRGASGFILMINGKPIQGSAETLLAQIPANAIDDIEIITAPSAKYDPDGKARIINIKTRKSVLDGFFLNTNVLVGLPSIEDYDNADATPRYGADITMNYKKNKWDILQLTFSYRLNQPSKESKFLKSEFGGREF